MPKKANIFSEQFTLSLAAHEGNQVHPILITQRSRTLCHTYGQDEPQEAEPCSVSTAILLKKIATYFSSLKQKNAIKDGT